MTGHETSNRSSDPTATLRASFFAWRIYMMVIGASLVLAPNFAIGLVGFPPVHDNWVRLLGVLIINVGLVYSPRASQPFQKGFVAWTIYGRYSFAAFTVLFVLLGWFPPNLLILGAMDALSATWTWVGMKKAFPKRGPA